MFGFRFSRFAIVPAVLVGLLLTAMPASAQRLIHRGTPTFVPFHFVPTHFVVPQNFTAARAVMINPFLRTSVVNLNPMGTAVAFNPFFRTNLLTSFPNARLVTDPFGVSTAFFTNNFPHPNNVTVTTGSLFPIRMGHMWPWMMNPNYGAGMGMYGAGMMGYGGGSGGGYGGGGSYSPMTTNIYAPSQTPSAENTAPSVDWPVGLRVLPGTDLVRQRLTADLMAMGKSPSGDEAASLKADAMREVKQLRDRLNESGYKLASGTVTDARQFLDQIEAALQTQP